jgi:GNAT superfamily N-acetyltransferase
VEVRSDLFREDCEIFGLEQKPMLSLVLRETDTGTVFIVGTPKVSAVQLALESYGPGTEVIAPLSEATWLSEALPGWTASRIILHLLKYPQQLPVTSANEVDFLNPATLGQLPIPADLLGELRSGSQYSRIAATFVGGQPVSFCYAGACTESLWDISIDTLPEHRRRGYAALCVAYMIRHLHTEGKQPVWASVDKNPASWRLARKLGFEPVDELVLFEPVPNTQHQE